MRSPVLAALLGVFAAVVETSILPWMGVLRNVSLLAIGAAALSLRPPMTASFTYAVVLAVTAAFFRGDHLAPRALLAVTALLIAHALVRRRTLTRTTAAVTVALLLTIGETLVRPALIGSWSWSDASHAFILTAILTIAVAFTQRRSTVVTTPDLTTRSRR